jgi:putative acetyltransferase
VIAIRPARDEDGTQLIGLIGPIFAEYENCIFDVDGEIPELRRIASAFDEWNGCFWVAEDQPRVVGCVGLTPAQDPRGIELKKLYVAKSARRHGLGGQLEALVVREARARGAAFVDLWSDTKFETAHRFYERNGYVCDGRTRELHDRSNTVEYYFKKTL